MGLFTGIGDFFRGSFGEDDEEKKRRKLREQQQAQVKVVQKPVVNKPTVIDQPQERPQYNAFNGVFGDKKPKTAVETIQKVVKEAPRVQPLVDKEFKGFTAEKKDRKFLPDNTTIKLDRSYKTNKDKFVADFDKMAPKYRQAYYNKVRDLAKGGDLAAQNAFNALQDTNRQPREDALQNAADIASLPGRSIVRVATGIPQGVSGIVDLVSPGEGNSRVTKALNKAAEFQDKAAEEAGIGKAYKALNVPVEIASYFIPSTLAVKIAGKFPKGAKITEEAVELIAKNVDNAGDAGKVRKFLADRMRRGWTMEEAIQESLINNRYIGQNSAKGNATTPTSVATDMVTGTAGSLLFPAKAVKNILKPEDLPTNVVDDALAATAVAARETFDKTGRNADELIPAASIVDAEQSLERKGLRNITEDELKVLVDDETSTALSRKEAQIEIKRRKAIADQAEFDADPLNKPAFQHKKDIENVIVKEEENFNRYINENPDLTPQQIEAAQLAAKERTVKLVEKLQESRRAGLDAVDNQADELANQVEGQQTVNETVKTQQAAQSTPPPASGESTPPPPNPELAANDVNNFNSELGIDPTTGDIGYVPAQQQLEKIAGNKTIEDLTGRQMGRISSDINEKTQGAAANYISNGAGGMTGRLLTSQNPVFNTIGQVLYAFNKKSTLSNAGKSLVEQVKGRRGGIDNLRQEVVAGLDLPLAQLDEATQLAVKENVFKSFELYNNGQIDESLALIKSFSPEERAYFDGIRELNILRNDLNRTILDADLIQKYSNGMHMPRIYDQDAFLKEFDGDAIEAYANSQGKTLDLNPAKRRKQLEDIAEELRATMLRDPGEASAIRTEIALHNKAVSDYSASISALPGAVSEVPLKGFLEVPDTPRYGEAAGKYVRRDLGEAMLTGDMRFKSAAYQKINSLLDGYQKTVFGRIEQGLRKALTVYNPGTRTGNRFANLSQGAMAGFNLPEMAVSQQHFMNVLKNGGDEWTRLAKTFGAIDDNSALLKFSGGYTEPKGTWFKNRTQSYQNVDTAAKVAMFKWRINKGATPQEAARFVNRALPNIGNSGEIYSFFSKLPIFGTPFRAIQPEVLRAMASTASRNTVPFLVAMGTYTTLQNMSWRDVEPEERKQIQERFGSGQTPFAPINQFFGDKGIQSDKVLPSSWSINAAGIPGVEGLFADDPEGGDKVVDVDPRRLLGTYSINLGGNPGKEGIIDQALKASPANIPVGYNNGEFEFQPQNVVGSRIAGPAWQAFIDKDFRGKSINNPDRGDNVVDPETLQPLNETQGRDNPGRTLSFLARNYLTPVNDGLNVVDAAQGKENFYGQKPNLWQSIMRFGGLKGEEFDKERLRDMSSTGAYFDEKKAIEDKLEGMTPASQAAYKRLTGYDKLDEQVPNEFKEGETRYKKAPVYEFGEDKWKDYASNPDLYTLMVEKKAKEQASGKPLQPEFDQRLSESFRKQLIQNKMVAPGDDAELDQRMYSDPEWDYYMNLKDQYKEKAKAYYPDDGNDDFTDELVKHQDAKFPTKPAVLKAYGAAYGEYADGKRDKPEFTDEVKAAKEAYNIETFKWTNTERLARGLPAITWDVWNNPTFGFDSSKSGGFGFGGGGGGSNRPLSINNLGNLSNYSNSVKRFEDINPADIPDIARLFATLKAGSGGGRQKPKLGASSSGQ